MFDFNDLKIPKRFRDKIKIDLDKIMGMKIEGLIEVRLFGSCARGEAKLGSDVDLLLLFNEEIPDRRSRGSLYCEVSEEIEGVKTDLAFYTTKDYNENKLPFSKAVRKESILIWEAQKPIMN